jgi:hypothetical protein
MEKWSGDGNLDWENTKTGDKVSPRRKDSLVDIHLEKLCTHAEGTYCIFCISRLRWIAEIAQRLLDPGSSAYAIEEKKQPGQFPEHLALVNFFVKSAYCLKFDILWKVRGFRTIPSGVAGETNTSRKLLSLLDYKTSCRVSDAQYIRGFRVRLGEDTSEGHAKLLWDRPVSFLIDGDYLVDRVPLRDLLGKSEVPFKRDETLNLFHASTVRNPDDQGMGEVHSDDWVGYMAVNGSHVQVIMEDVPVLESPVKIEIEFDLVSYTTRGFAQGIREAE